MALLSINNLTKQYPGNEKLTLSGVDFQIDEGELVALVGPSGSGKSTILHLIAGIDNPTGGEVLFQGKNIFEYSQEELKTYQGKYIGSIFQAFHVIPYLTVEENISLPQVFDHTLHASEKKKRVEELIEKVGLKEQAQKKASEVSGGQRQRIAIARALVNSPTLILADEPTGNLDMETGQGIMDLLKSLVAEEGRSIVLVTHETYYLPHMDKVFEVKSGKVVNTKRSRGVVA